MQRFIWTGMLAALFSAASVWAADGAFVPEKALVQKSKNHQVTVKDGVFSASNTAPGIYTNLHFNLAGMAFQPDSRLCFEYRVELPAGVKVRYVGVAFDFKDAGATFNLVPSSAAWKTARLDMRSLKFHKKIPAKPGEAMKQLHIYCRMPNEAPGTALLQVRNLRFEKASPAKDFSASKAFVRSQKRVNGSEKNGVFTVENTVPLTSVPMTFLLHGMPYNPQYRLSFEYRSEVLNGGKERYTGVNFGHRTGGTTFHSFPASGKWASAVIPLGELKFHKAGKLKKGEPLDRITIYSRLDNEAPGKVRLEVKNVRFEKDPFFDAKANVRLSYSALPLVSWQKDDAAESYTVICTKDGKEVYTAKCKTPYFVPAKAMQPGIYHFTVKSSPSGKPAASEEVEVPDLHHTWRMPEYDFAAFAARPRPRLKKLAQYWNPDADSLIKSMKRTAPTLRIAPNPELYKEGADPNIRSWVEWYGKVAGGIVSRTGSNLQKLGMAAVLSGAPDLKKYAKEKALIVARTWDPESGSSMSKGDLQAANLLRGLVWCYDAAYDVMTPEERKTFADCILVRGNQFWKSTYPFRSNEAQN
ncbi:MAG: DUF4962 domain-containing protein, partial [Lentisphaeria bacterium]|nr:DUF4962 domain-containing protein [Lentisphaeria bacterium]